MLINEKETCYQCGMVLDGSICRGCGQDPDECTCVIENPRPKKIFPV